VRAAHGLSINLRAVSAEEQLPPRVSADELLPPGVTVGRHSYGFGPETFKIFMGGARIELGAFCSVGPEVRILAGSEHVITRAASFPLKTFLFDPGGGNAEEAIDRGVTSIGNDVWLGLRSNIMSGVQVGHGAVIAAGAVVTRNVPPYAMVAGNPARLIRYRFSEEIRQRLLTVTWWDWSEPKLHAFQRWFMSDVETFLRHAEESLDER
jgi:acetyltransferase-like isoleucine patch superfamily enzyme